MNERIKELAEQATEIIEDETEIFTEDMNIPTEWYQKFAELIVKECMEAARPFYMSTPEDSVYYVEQAINRIADHFGVEE